uniref:acid phosphatase n=1 Tax=Caenorhabditis tropicalis TaxID=1561998 RepID=A0A1I7UAC6_9PELO
MRVLFYVFLFVIIAIIQAQLISVHVEGIEQSKLIGKVLKDRYVNSFVDPRMLPTQWFISEKALQRATSQSNTLKERSEENLPALILEKEAGLAVPSWFNEEAYKESLTVFYKALSVMASVGEYHSVKGIRIKTGLLLDKIINDIKEKVRCHEKKTEGVSCDRQKLQVFSTHDLLMLPFLEALGIREEVLGKDLPPEFLSAVIIETMLVDGIPFVKVFYRKNPREITLRDVTDLVRNCPPKKEYCPVDLFTSCCSEFLTTDPKGECYPETSDENTIQWAMTPLSWLLAAIAIFLLVVLIIMTYLVIRYKNQSVVTIKKFSLEN